ncbi:MAG: S8 family serine peptidase [Gemmataceae bacterium]
MTPLPRNVFDEIRALMAPERFLHDPRANGSGVRIAVLDSGIERATLVERFAQQQIPLEPIEGVIFRGQPPVAHPYEGRQSSPHGTTVADIILTIAPRATLFSVDVFGPQGHCEVETIVAALRYAIDTWNVKIVNLSLGVPEQRLQQAPRRQMLLRAIEEAYFRDVLVFAAASNEHPLTRSYPAVYSPPLISVDKALFTDPLRFAYRLKEQIEFQAHGRGYLGPFTQEPTTSWATPHLAGIAARILALQPDLKPFELKTILYWLFRAANTSSTTA